MAGTPQQQINGTLAVPYPPGKELAVLTDLSRPYPKGTEPGDRGGEVSGVTGGDGSRVTQFYGLDTDAYYFSNAGGSQGASGRAADSVPTEITPPSGAWYDRHDVPTHGAVLPDQNSGNQICGGDDGDFTTSGIGPKGGTDAWGRFDYQQRPGRG